MTINTDLKSYIVIWVPFKIRKFFNCFTVVAVQ